MSNDIEKNMRVINILSQIEDQIGVCKMTTENRDGEMLVIFYDGEKIMDKRSCIIETASNLLTLSYVKVKNFIIKDTVVVLNFEIN